MTDIEKTNEKILKKAITFEKTANHTKYKKPNASSHLHIF